MDDKFQKQKSMKLLKEKRSAYYTTTMTTPLSFASTTKDLTPMKQRSSSRASSVHKSHETTPT